MQITTKIRNLRCLTHYIILITFLLFFISCTQLNQKLNTLFTQSYYKTTTYSVTEPIEITSGFYILPINKGKNSFSLPPDGSSYSFNPDMPKPPGGVWVKFKWSQSLNLDRLQEFMVVHKIEGPPLGGGHVNYEENAIVAHWWPPTNLWQDSNWFKKWEGVNKLMPPDINVSSKKIIKIEINDPYWISKENYRFIIK